MKVNPDILKRPKREVTRYSFKDAYNPEVEWVMHLGPLNPFEDAAAEQLAAELIIKYIRGGWRDEDGDWHKDPMPIHAVDGEAVKVVEPVLRAAAFLECMQDPPDPEDKYSAIEICRMASAMHDAWYNYRLVLQNLLGGDGWLKKDLEGATEPPSETPSEVGSGTQNLS